MNKLDEIALRVAKAVDPEYEKLYRTCLTKFSRALLADPELLTELSKYAEPVSFQSRVYPWLIACFGEEISNDRMERNHRFLEESLELVQSTGCTQSEAHQLVDYVYGRPTGEPYQEVGGVMVTLAALCLANGLDMHANGEIELERIWTKVEKIRAKQAAKPKHSPLPEHPAPVIASEQKPVYVVPPAWTNLIEYVLQDDLHNRLTPRVVDIAYTAFMLAKEPNKEDGGNSDWFNDTRPSVMKAIAKLRKDLVEFTSPPNTADIEQRVAQACAALCGTRGLQAPYNQQVRSDEAQACEAEILSGKWREYQ